jgi:hypothetical protein
VPLESVHCRVHVHKSALWSHRVSTVSQRVSLSTFIFRPCTLKDILLGMGES